MATCSSFRVRSSLAGWPGACNLVSSPGGLAVSFNDLEHELWQVTRDLIPPVDT